jgi:ketosteroid isomerase-like protein
MRALYVHIEGMEVIRSVLDYTAHMCNFQGNNAVRSRKAKRQPLCVFRALRAVLAFPSAPLAGSLYTFNGQLFPPHSEMVSGRLAIERFWHSTFAAGLTGATRTALEVQGRGDTVYEVGQDTLLGEGDVVRDTGRYVVIWHLEPRQWKRHRDIWTTSMPAPGS